MRITHRLCLCLFVALLASTSRAYEPIPRRLPPAGKPIPEEARANLSLQLGALRTEAAVFKDNPLLPDVEIYLKAVDLALEFGEFYKPLEDVAKAERALATAKERLRDLQGAQSPWEQEDGLVVRGYRSKIDGSAQPYGLEILKKLNTSNKPVPLYVWLHGRGDSNTDLHFLDDRTRKHWQFKGLLDDGIVLHPFGRQCIGYKSAGEIDVLDAVDHVVKNYNVDPHRIALMGFSMGGAGAWHLGAHYADKWAVVHAGAGFVDVKRYQNLGPDQMPPAVEQTLWGLYDVPDYARNLLNIPVVAYSGETDKQKDAADYMAEVLHSHGHELTHIVGPGMGHKYDEAGRKQVAAFVKRALAKPKNRNPDSIHLQTRTLRYNKYAWLEITGLIEHWKDSRVDAEFTAPNRLEITTKNVRSFLIRRKLPDSCRLIIDGKDWPTDPPPRGLHYYLDAGEWSLTKWYFPPERKAPRLQGPIDDAFLAPFLVVTPTGTSKNSALDEWVNFELEHFKTRWRALFRADLPTVKDTELTEERWGTKNLILFGTPDSNKQIADYLVDRSLKWPGDPDQLLLAVYPVLLKQEKRGYVVLNSGPTFREAHDRTNSLQNPKLGDWAIIDLSEPPGPERPGKIVKAGFFDENWQLP